MPSNQNVKNPSPAKQSETTYCHFGLNDPCDNRVTPKVIEGQIVPDNCCNNNSTQYIEDHFKRWDIEFFLT